MAEPPYGHEPSGIAVRRVLGVGAVLAVGVIVTVIAVCLVLQRRLEPARLRSAHQSLIPPAPRLQAHPSADLAALRAQKQALLEGWGWTDGSRRFAHIPIEQAMAIYARQHASADSSPTVATASAPEGAR
jgi:hypothetical protein